MANIKEVKRIVESSTAPNSHKEALWLDTSVYPGIFRIYTLRGKWEPIGASTAQINAIKELTQKVESLNKDSVTKEYVDGEVAKLQALYDELHFKGNADLTEDLDTSKAQTSTNSDGSITTEGPIDINFPQAGAYMVVINTAGAGSSDTVTINEKDNLGIYNNKVVFTTAGDKVSANFNQPTTITSINYIQQYAIPTKVSYFENDAEYISMKDLIQTLNTEYQKPEETLIFKINTK